MKKRQKPTQAIVISDPHIGCQFGLCDPKNMRLDSGAKIKPNKIQLFIRKHWDIFNNEWIPSVTQEEPYYYVINGDVIDGVHHGSTTQWTQNLEDQKRHAEIILRPVVEKAYAYYHIRGTEAHVGKSGQEEESLARALGAIPDEAGCYARHDLWLRLGKSLVHFLHHIGTSSSAAYESTAPFKELIEEFNASVRQNAEAPNAIVRSHRHMYIKTEISTANGQAFALTTPGWQGKTPFTWKIANARLSVPSFGGVLLRWTKDAGLYSRVYNEYISRSKTEGE